MLCSYARDLISATMKIFARKNADQFAPELLGQFNWIVQYTPHYTMGKCRIRE